MSAPLGADEVAAILSLVPLPEEGGRWAQTVLDGDSSAIHYLLTDGDFVAASADSSPLRPTTSKLSAAVALLRCSPPSRRARVSSWMSTSSSMLSSAFAVTRLSRSLSAGRKC